MRLLTTRHGVEAVNNHWKHKNFPYIVHHFYGYTYVIPGKRRCGLDGCIMDLPDEFRKLPTIQRVIRSVPGCLEHDGAAIVARHPFLECDSFGYGGDVGADFLS
jgi:hypothetical protein